MHHHESEVDRFNELIHSRSESGWDFAVGYPEHWQQSSRLLVPGGRVLDLGAELGNTSMPFALTGMSVTAIDNHPGAVAELRKIALNRELAFTVRLEDLTTAEIEAESYDLVLIAELLTHIGSKEAGYRVLDKAIAAVKPGGHIWLRTSGKDSSDYRNLSEGVRLGYIPGDITSRGYDTSELVSPDTFGIRCFHYGNGENIDFRTFYGQTELLFYFITNGLKIIEADTAPLAERPNIMYGENWSYDSSQIGFITLLGHKPAR